MEHGSVYWMTRTYHYYEYNISVFLEYVDTVYGSDVLLSELPDHVLKDYTLYLRRKDKYEGHPLRDKMNVNGSIKAGTVNTYMRAVRAFFNWLYDSKYTDLRYTEGLRMPKSDKDQIVPLLASEVIKIDSIFDQENVIDLRNLCIIHLMLDAGLRSSEVINLKVSDLIFESNTIVINRSKNQKSRVVLMAPVLKDFLKTYILKAKPVGTLLLKENENKGINYNVLVGLFDRIKNNTGISRVHPHLLRHTFATSYIIGGGNLESLRILLGHADYGTTRIYLHLAKQFEIMGYDIYRLDDIFFKGGYSHERN
jgi:integrase/recombinase XerC/integrase/recombinase XerD